MKNYEISIWEDIANGSGIFQERKIAVIGSDSMTSEARAFDPVLVRNINGTHTLTFKMYYICNDFSLDGMEKGFEKYNNPFISLMVNERKVKLHWKDKWYDFIIKNCQEDSNGKSVTYTCKDLFLNELGKTGFNLEFDNELLNNSGTISELGARVLEGTDWKISESQGIILQEHEEPVYETASIKATFTGTKDGTSTTRSFTTSNSILLFHSCVPTIDDDGNLQGGAAQCQFLFTTDSSWQTELNKMLVINADCYSTPTGTWSKYVDSSHPENSRFRFSVNNTVIIDLPLSALVSNNYRGTRLVKAQKQEIDKVLNRSVYVYTDTTNPSVEYWGYPATEFNKPTLVNNLFVNYENFSSVEGWNGLDTFRLYPLMQEYTGSAEDYEATSYLKINASSTVVNKGLQDTYMSFPDGFIKGEKYIFRYKAKANTSGNVPGSYVTTGVFTPRVASYNTTVETPTPITNYFSFGSATRNGDWIEFEGTCTTSISKHEIVTGIGSVTIKLGLFLVNSNAIRWLEKVEFFRKVMGLNASNQEVRINPGEISTRSVGEIYYNYYLPGQEVSDPSEIVYAYHNTVEWDQVTPAYRDNPFEEVRSITAKNSNRFNLLQTIAESFDCYCEFIIEHNDDGSIQYTTSAPIEAKKYVKFVRDIGQDNGLSFTYGLDLKNISRTIASDQIVTKMIVPKNSNSFGTNGFCTIARCDENYPRVNYILNFDYYISHGMIDGSELNRDLYSSVDIDMGYYYNLHRYNVEYDEITEKLTKRNSELTEQLAYQTTYAEALESTVEELNRCKDYLIRFCGVEDMTGVIAFIKRYPDDAELNARNINYNRLLRQRDNYNSLLSSVATSIGLLQNDIDTYTARQKDLKDLILALDKEFYTKYSRYIQEGSWNSEDYYDDLDYYLDAVNVCYTSSRPQVSYNINVMRLSEIEEYQNRKFELGDICYIQDTEFFGYVQNADFRTPYKEKVLISEVSEVLDDPTRNTFKVQNYKTQFEDLFQRITATTQSLQYKDGEYSRAASVVTTERTIDADVLQNSITLNEELVISAQNESIYQDNTGITLIDNANPDHRLKITSNGIFVTNDGVWRNALRGDGVVTEMLSAGNINTNKIVISDGVFTAFRWDSTGINAYQQLYDAQNPTQKIGVDLSTSVRFDHFGLYGIQNVPNGSFIPTSEEQIWNNVAAKFGLTWKGFFLRTNNTNGKIEISSDKDFTISQKNGGTWYERVKIGRLAVDGSGDPSDTLYGIRISDLTGNPVLETVADGELWLKKALHISNTTGTNYNIAVGYLNGVKPNTSIHEVFNANNVFIVYEDGSMKATDGEFTGKIVATSGRIGNLEINTTDGSLETVSKIEISSDLGYNYNVSGTTVNPSTLTLKINPIGLPDDLNPGINWYYSNNFSTWNQISNQHSLTCDIIFANFTQWQSNNVCYFKAQYTTSYSTVYVGYTTLYQIADGENADAINYTAYSNQEEIYKVYREDDTTHTSELNFSAETVGFWVKKIEDDIETTLSPVNDYDTVIEVVNSDSSLINVWVLLNKLYGRDSNNVLTHMIDVGRTIASETNMVIFNFSDLFDYEVKEEDNQNYLDEVRDFYSLTRILSMENTTIIFKVYKRDTSATLTPEAGLLVTIKAVPVSFSVSEAMAKFALTAAAIEQAVGNTTLTFDVSGLTVKNGGFKILGGPENGTTLLEYDQNSNSLSIVGNGEFTGKITATEGEFTGTVHALDGEFSGVISAATGEIGGWIIRAGGLYSKLGATEVENPPGSGTYVLNVESSYIKLLSDDGTIVAQNIELGNGAVVSDYIHIGNAYIKNSTKYDGLFIESGNIKLYDNSILELGNIKVDGANSTITGANWFINNNRAVFDNIDIRGTIRTSVFEIGSIQAVGGTILFKTAFKINCDGTTNIQVVDTSNMQYINVGDYIYFTGKGTPVVYIVASKNTTNNTFVVKDSGNNNISLTSDYEIATILANVNNNTLVNNLIIGVNATDAFRSFLYPRGFTFIAPTQYSTGAQSNLDMAPSLFLGDLQSIAALAGITLAENKYGLYGDNVFLKGTLTTQISAGSYAGINTLNGAEATKFDNDHSKIVFWAGSTNSTTEAIQNAPFQVTESGSLYAAQGLFEGSIITNSIIQGTDIYTVNIHGGSDGSSAALNIYDTAEGIVFKHGYNTENDSEDFRITNTGICYGSNRTPFLTITNSNVVVKSNEYYTISVDNGTGTLPLIHIKEDRIYTSFVNEDNIEEQRNNIKFDKDGFLFYIIENGSNVSKLEIMNETVEIKTENAMFDNTVIYGNVMQYKKAYINGVLKGYNLYVVEGA